MRRRRRGRLFALGLATLATLAVASCGDAAFDLLPAEVRVDAGAGSSQDGGNASLEAGAGGAGGSTQFGGQGGTEPPLGFGGSCDGPGCEQDCAPWEPLCVPCEDETDCDEPTPYCEPNFNLCVECRSNVDCDVDETCDPLSGSCAPSCSDINECDFERPLCDQARGICVECIEDAHCRTDSSSPFCVIGKCVECFTSQHCPEFRPYCDRFVCAECFEDWQCDADQHCEDGDCEDNF